MLTGLENMDTNMLQTLWPEIILDMKEHIPIQIAPNVFGKCLFPQKKGIFI